MLKYSGSKTLIHFLLYSDTVTVSYLLKVTRFPDYLKVRVWDSSWRHGGGGDPCPCRSSCFPSVPVIISFSTCTFTATLLRNEEVPVRTLRSSLLKSRGVLQGHRWTTYRPRVKSVTQHLYLCKTKDGSRRDRFTRGGDPGQNQVVRW